MVNAEPLRGTDRVLRYTKILAITTLPFLVGASVLLVVLPGLTTRTFAWTTTSIVTVMTLGSAYLAGTWFCVQVVMQRRWHRVRHGFPAMFVVSALVAAAALLHWDEFHAEHGLFIVWIVVHLMIPLLVFAALILNGPADSGASEDHDAVVPLGIRIAFAAAGVIIAAVGAILFVAPTLLIDVWAWDVTPLSARIVGAVFTIPGTINLLMLVDPRWTAFRWVFQAELVTLAFIVIAFVVGFNDLYWNRPSTWIVTIGITAMLIACVSLFAWLDRRRGPISIAVAEP